MQNNKLLQRVHELALSKTEELGIRIWDIDFLKEGSIYCLTIYLDADREININDCEAVSRYIDPLLDDKEFDKLPSYTLCVSSAGLERKLVRPEHFEKNIGSLIHLGFYKSIDGAKFIEGTLESYENGDVTINIDGDVKTFVKKDIANARLAIKF